MDWTFPEILKRKLAVLISNGDVQTLFYSVEFVCDKNCAKNDKKQTGAYTNEYTQKNVPE